MDRNGHEVHVSDEEASGGRKEGVVRWILIVGTLLAVVLLSLIWIIPAATTPGMQENVSVSRQIQESQGAQDSNLADLNQEGDTNIDETAGQMQDGLATVPNTAATPTDNPG